MVDACPLHMHWPASDRTRPILCVLLTAAFPCVSVGFLEVHSAALVQLMLHTLPYYQDLASQRAVLTTIRQAVANGTFLKTLAGAIVKLDAASVSRQVWLANLLPLPIAPLINLDSALSNLQECFVLLCWTAAVLRHLQPQSAKKAVIKLVECQVGPLCNCSIVQPAWAP